MRRTSLSFLLGLMAVVGSFSLSVSSAWAIGSGSGGYYPTEPTPTPTCTADTWSCGSYGTCSVDGVRVRECVLKADCPGVETAKPAISQKCTPPSTPAPVPVPVSEGQGDAVVSETPRCGNLSSAVARISCRLQLTSEQLVVEQKALYLPEECRSFAEGEVRDLCIARYKSFAPCWASAPGEARFACSRTAVGLTRSVADEARACAAIADIDDKRECIEVMRTKTFNAIKFRFYDLEKRAEDLIEKGATVEQVAEFIAFITEQKIAFNNATSDAARRAVILEVRTGWKNFLAEVRASLQ